MGASRRVLRVGAVIVLVAGAVALSGCNPPPVITQAQVAAKSTPKKHPTLSDKQKANCAGCHRVVAAKGK